MTAGGNADNRDHKVEVSRAVCGDGRLTWRAKNPLRSGGYSELHPGRKPAKFLGWDEARNMPIIRTSKSKEKK